MTAEKRHSRSGVSLLDTLIALALFGMIGSILATAFSSTGRALITGVETRRELELATNRALVREWVDEMPSTDAGIFESPPVQGDSTSISLRLWFDEGMFAPDQPVLLDLTVSDESLVFIAEGKSADTDEALTWSLPIFDGVDGFELAYLDADGQWIAEWVSTGPPPLLVRLEVFSDRGGPPILTLRPQYWDRYRYRSLSSPFPPG